MDPTTLADRLRGIIRGPGVSRDPLGLPAGLVPASSLLSRPSPPQPDEAALTASARAALGGDWSDCEGHRAFVVERRVAADVAYGDVVVGDLASALHRSAAVAPLVAGGAPAVPPLLFFDLETTGLSGGAGTHAFLVGCGWFDADGGFVTRQYVMLRYPDEKAMLKAVAAEFERAGALVSFNGKSFDAPVLETRFLFHRLDWRANRKPHIDVLHPARRFWRDDEMASCALGLLETTVLGARRVGDVPGMEIPARYFGFVRNGDAGPLEAVLEHNRLDLLSLAGLTARLLHLLDRGGEAVRDGREALALGRVYERGGKPAEALRAYRAAVSREAARPAGRVRLEALRALALCYRRERRHEDAAACWADIVQTRGCPRPMAREATEALAIHHEHRARDLETARLFAMKSLEGEQDQARTSAVQYRLARLERKIAGAASGGALLLSDVDGPSGPSRR